MENQRFREDLFRNDCAGDEFGGVIFRFPLPELPADDLAAVDVQEEVEVVVESPLCHNSCRLS